MVAMGILVIILSFAGIIFRVSINSHRTAAANAEIMQKLRAITSQLNADFKGLNKDGEIFEFTIITNQGNEQRRKIAEVIQRRLADIGVRVEIRILEWTVFLSEFIDKRNFEAVLLGWGLGLDPDNFDIWHSSKTREGEFNFISYKNEEVDQLLEQARRTCSQEERRVCYQRIHEIIYDEQPYMFLCVPDSLSIVHSRVQGIRQAPIGIRYNLIDWWVPKQQQRYRIEQ